MKFDLLIDDAITYAADLCVPADAKFVTRREHTDDRVVSVTGGLVAFDGANSGSIVLCNRTSDKTTNDPVFLSLVDGLFY
jgi:hypothetical protein